MPTTNFEIGREPATLELSEKQLAQISGGPDTPLCQACSLAPRSRPKPASDINQYLSFEDYDASA